MIGRVCDRAKRHNLRLGIRRDGQARAGCDLKPVAIIEGDHIFRRDDFFGHRPFAYNKKRWQQTRKTRQLHCGRSTYRILQG